MVITERMLWRNLGTDPHTKRMVVAVAVLQEADGDLFDWAAYIGTGGALNENSSEAKEERTTIAIRGTKLMFEYGTAIFPFLPAEKWRA